MKTKRKILVVWRGYFPSFNKKFPKGPTSPVVYEIFRRVVNQGFDVTIICWHFDGQLFYELVDGINIIRVKSPYIKYIKEQLWGLKISFVAIWKLITEDIDLFHIVGEPIWHGWGIIIAKMLGISVVVSFLDAWYFLFNYENQILGKPKGKLGIFNHLFLNNRFVITFLEKFFAINADKMTVVTDDLKNYFINLGIPESKIHTIPNAATIYNLEKMKIDCLKSKHKLEKDEIVIGYLGSINRIHGVELLLTSFIKLCKKYEKIKLMFIGDGDSKYVEMLCLQIPADVKNKIIFTGKVDYLEVSNYVALIDCGFICWENTPAMSCASPLKLFEYLACGKPVVGGCTRHIQDVIKKSQAGIYIEKPTIEDVTNKLELFLNLSSDEKDKLAQNAKQFILENWNWDIVAGQYISIYNSFFN